jgi:hypothetical protein
MRLLHYAAIRFIIAILLSFCPSVSLSLSLSLDILTLLPTLSEFHFLRLFRVNILLTATIIHLTTVVSSRGEKLQRLKFALQEN